MGKKKLAIVDCNYPNETNLYGDVFVHSRVKYYLNEFDVKVFGWNKRLQENRKYTYENVSVEEYRNKEEFVTAVKNFSPSVMGFHFVQWWMVSRLIMYLRIPTLIWVHGHEGLGWYRRLFLYTSHKDIPYFLKYIPLNTIQMFCMNRLIRFSNETKIVKFIFVSEWMRSITETDTISNIEQYTIIPNPIDTSIFKYTHKPVSLRKNILLIRSFQDSKYATDIATDAIRKLMIRSEFNDFNFTIVGVGRFFEKHTEGFHKFKNIRLINSFIRNSDIPNLHREHGVFLCPTRQDAQGVSMCEAMSSGLIPISSNNTAIPEYVDDLESGFLTSNSDDIVEVFLRLYHSPELFEKMSYNASHNIQRKASHEMVLTRELDIIRVAANGF